MATVDQQLRAHGDTISEHADYLDALARSVRDLNSWRDGLRRADLEARLGVGGPPRGGLVPGATGQGLMGGFLGGYSGSPSAPNVADTLGNVQPWVGQANVLLDPTFETVFIQTTIGAGSTQSGRWYCSYTLNSGSLPALHSFDLFSRRGAGNLDPFNSDVVSLAVSGWGANAGNIDLYVFPVDTFTPAGPVLPYLVGSVRAYLDIAVGATVDVATATLEIVKFGGTVYSSQVVDLKTLTFLEPILLVVAHQDTPTVFGSNSWRWRLHLHIEKPASSDGATALRFAEPQLHFSYTPDPVLFTPAIANWYPSVRPADPQGITAASYTIQAPALGHGVLVWLGPTGVFTMTSTPTIPDGLDGQEIVLYNNTANTLTIQDQGTLAGSNLRLTAATVALGARDSVRLMFVQGLGDWVQIGPVVNVL